MISPRHLAASPSQDRLGAPRLWGGAAPPAAFRVPAALPRKELRFEGDPAAFPPHTRSPPMCGEAHDCSKRVKGGGPRQVQVVVPAP